MTSQHSLVKVMAWCRHATSHYLNQCWPSSVTPSLCHKELNYETNQSEQLVYIVPLSIVFSSLLTHWGRVTHICVFNVTIIGSDNGLSPGRRQAITWTNVGILLIGPLGTNFSEMLIEIHTFSFKKIHLKMSSGKWRPFCLGLNVLKLDSVNLSAAYFVINGCSPGSGPFELPIPP